MLRVDEMSRQEMLNKKKREALDLGDYAFLLRRRVGLGDLSVGGCVYQAPGRGLSGVCPRGGRGRRQGTCFGTLNILKEDERLEGCLVAVRLTSASSEVTFRAAEVVFSEMTFKGPEVVSSEVLFRGPEVVSSEVTFRGPEVVSSEVTFRGPDVVSSEVTFRGPEVVSSEVTFRGPEVVSAEVTFRGPEVAFSEVAFRGPEVFC
ncbi:hypothetical protein EYF80_049955 [Liparis tanakae]|uniref:Uncharacterized protein n=1 Tax=Liparis tanakae TaxID=230148 RepID=A0A4Z2FGJ8_9TELE|nr:hypothetical protein EYF80_049955 [Liparis tanakae]